VVKNKTLWAPEEEEADILFLLGRLDQVNERRKQGQSMQGIWGFNKDRMLSEYRVKMF